MKALNTFESLNLRKFKHLGIFYMSGCVKFLIMTQEGPCSKSKHILISFWEKGLQYALSKGMVHNKIIQLVGLGSNGES